MAQAGADIVVCHMGLTTGGAIGAETALDAGRRASPLSTRWAEAAARCSDDVIVLVPRRPDRHARGRAVHPRRIARACHGFYGASSMERLPDRDRADRDDPAVQGDPP